MSLDNLSMFIGTEHYYAHILMPGVCYTDGIKYVAEEGKAYWLVDLIVSGQVLNKVRKEDFQVWTLKVKDNKGSITADDGNGNVIYKQEIEYTDFPLPEIKIYVENGVIMLPSER